MVYVPSSAVAPIMMTAGRGNRVILGCKCLYQKTVLRNPRAREGVIYHRVYDMIAKGNDVSDVS